MIKLKIIPYALVGLTVGLSGCDRGGSKVRGSGVAKTETRTVEAFERIHIQGFAKLDVAIGEIEPLQVTADDNILPVLETTVQNGQLVIRPTVPIKPDTTITVRVRMPNITEVLCDGAGSIRLDGVENDALTITINGAGLVEAAGRTQTLKASINGAGQLSLAALEAGEATLDITGAGQADVTVSDSLTVSLTGAGSVTYRGDPKLEKRILGIGTVTKKGD